MSVPRIRSVSRSALAPPKLLSHSRTFPTLAARLLAPVYGWFTEGFDAANLKDAKGRCSTSWHERRTFGRVGLIESARSTNRWRPNLLKVIAYSFRACISASQEELQTWRLSAIG